MNNTQRQYKQLMRLDVPHFPVHITVNLSGGDWSHHMQHTDRGCLTEILFYVEHV